MANLKKLKRRKRMPEGGMVGIKDDKLKAGYPVGTPLKEIYNVPSDYSDYAKLLASGPTKDAMNRTRWANFEGKLTDYPEGRSVPSFRYTSAMKEEMEKRGMTRDYIESWQPSNYPEEFGLGGILGETAIGAGTGVLAGAPIGGIGALPGALIGGGVGLVKGLAGHFSEEGEADEFAEDFAVPQGLSRQHYQRAARGGDLTEFTGPQHEDGGVALGGLPVEVEGGETRTTDMIHSDRIKITPAMIKKYSVLKKSDKGKTMADITKREHKKFEKREFDELNDNAAEIAMMPFEQISEELSEPEYDDFEYLDDSEYAADGGDISAAKAREILSHGAIRGKPITDKQRRFFGAKTKAAGGLDLQTLGKYGPLISSGVDLVGSLIGGPEEVDYGKASVAPTKVSYASAEPGVQRIRRTFGSAESKLRKYNPNRYMARMGELTTREADVVTSHAGQIQTLNTQAVNRANILDASNAARMNMFNKQIGIREAEANAANREAWRSRISGNVANIGTMTGQMARDERLQESSDAARSRYFDILEEQNRILGGYGDVNSEEEDIFTNIDPLSAVPNYPLYADGGSLTHRLRLRNFKTA